MTVIHETNYNALVERYEQYKRFADMPDHMKTQQDTYNWARVIFPGAEWSLTDCWDQIPPELLSDALRSYLVANDFELIKLIHPNETPKYLGLCLDAYAVHFSAAGLFHEDFQTSETVGELLKIPKEFHLAYAEIPWVARVTTQEQLERAGMVNLHFMASLPDDQVTDAMLKAHLREGLRNSNFSTLRSRGKMKLIARFLGDGNWPFFDDPRDHIITKPKTVLEGLKRMASISHNHQALYMGYVMTFPIELVISLMTTKEQTQLALEMYSDKELRPLLHTNSILKAAMLEEALGL
jgi:hypothetical protein